MILKCRRVVSNTRLSPAGGVRSFRIAQPALSIGFKHARALETRTTRTNQGQSAASFFAEIPRPRLRFQR
jgi:hypothetical protein